MARATRSPQPIKALLAVRGIRQDQLAEQAGVSAHWLSRCLNGYERPSPELAAKLAELLDVDVTSLFVDDLADVVMQIVARTTATSNVSEVVEDPAAIQQVVAILRTGAA